VIGTVDETVDRPVLVKLKPTDLEPQSLPHWMSMSKAAKSLRGKGGRVSPR